MKYCEVVSECTSVCNNGNCEKGCPNGEIVRFGTGGIGFKTDKESVLNSKSHNIDLSKIPLIQK